MNILAVDDNRFALDEITEYLCQIRPDDNVYGFPTSRKALDFVNNECRSLDAAFLDIEMPMINGIELAVKIKTKFPRAVIVFVTAYPQYSLDAFKIHANGYLVKPVSAEMLQKELDALTSPFVLPQVGRVRVHTFGNFEIYVDEKPVKFARSKSKELIAYLIDRKGTMCTMNELAAVLLDDNGDEKSQQSYIRNLVSDIKVTLSELSADDVINKEHNGISVNVSEVDCDYYRLLNGEPTAVNSFLGEYMSNYSWAELTVGELNNNTHKKGS